MKIIKAAFINSLFLGLCLTLYSCHNNPKNQDESGSQTPENEISTYYKYLQGTIGNRKAILHLIKYQPNGTALIKNAKAATDDQYQGIYEDGTDGKPYMLQGYINQKHQLLLVTFDHYSPIDTFTGQFTNGSTFKGTFTDTTGKKTAFTFTEKYPAGSHHWQVASYSDSLKYDSAKAASPKARISYLTLWPGKGFSRPQKALIVDTISQAFFGAGKSFSNPGSLLQTVSDSFLQRYQMAAMQWKERDKGGPGPSFNWNATARTDLLLNANNRVSLMYTQYNFSGGAHGLQTVLCKVFDLKNNRMLHLSDIFKPGYQKELTQALEQQLRIQYDLPKGQPLNGKNGILFKDHLPISHNFYLTNKGIGFIYNPYEVAPYVVGEINLYLPFNKIKTLLQQ